MTASIEPTHVAWRTTSSTVEALGDDTTGRPIKVRGVPSAETRRVEVLSLTITEAAELELQLRSARVWVARRQTRAANPAPDLDSELASRDSKPEPGMSEPRCSCGHGPAWHSTPQPARTCLATGCNCTH